MLKRGLFITVMLMSIVGFTQKKEKLNAKEIKSIEVELYKREGKTHTIINNTDLKVKRNGEVTIGIVVKMNDGSIRKTKVGKNGGDLKFKDFILTYKGITEKSYGTGIASLALKAASPKANFLTSSDSKIEIEVYHKKNKLITDKKLWIKKADDVELDLSSKGIPATIIAPRGTKIDTEDNKHEIECKLRKERFMVDITMFKKTLGEKQTTIEYYIKMQKSMWDNAKILKETPNGFIYQDEDVYGLFYVIKRKGKIIQFSDGFSLDVRLGKSDMEDMFSKLQLIK